MTTYLRFGLPVLTALLAVLLLFQPGQSFAHCDSLDGPVVQAAEKALANGNVNLVLIWVQKNNETEVRTAFEKALAVRKLGADAKALADRYFFETVVRLHRAGEGAPYTGLKPAGRDLGPAIPAADKAIEAGSPEQVQRLLAHAVQDGIAKHFKDVLAKKNFDFNDVEGGREYVEAYVTFVHYVEGLYQAANDSAHGHYEEGQVAGGHIVSEDHK